MKNPNLLKAVNIANIVATLVFLGVLIFVVSINVYGGLFIVALGFPIVVIMAVVSFVFNIIFKSQNNIVGAQNIAFTIVSVIISVLWLIGFSYFMSNIGF